MDLVGANVLLGLNFQTSFDLLQDITEADIHNIKASFDFEEVEKGDWGYLFEKGYPFAYAHFSRNEVDLYLAYGNFFDNIIDLLNAFSHKIFDEEFYLYKVELVSTMNIKNTFSDILEESSNSYLKNPKSAEIKLQYDHKDGDLNLAIRFREKKYYALATFKKKTRITNSDDLINVVNDYKDIIQKAELDFFMAWSKRLKR